MVNELRCPSLFFVVYIIHPFEKIHIFIKIDKRMKESLRIVTYFVIYILTNIYLHVDIVLLVSPLIIS